MENKKYAQIPKVYQLKFYLKNSLRHFVNASPKI